ncbi:M48 family metallopeptidase [Thermomicrobiaceae bacterium CFH 74404]|uniref:M48 family metallopeptidase n=1 Tax=Thermalbibacter longus TaxID=2951981 RepID=A0AA41WD47_9BACT|nr:M48 family metallopeptidase [Thermalbibacter longus]MCM8748135.1 M48 family metallopeptidase [Thermalbibacter longus]
MAGGTPSSKGGAQGESEAGLPWLGAAVIVLILPVALWVGAWIVEARMNGAWRDAVEAEYGRLTAEEWELVRLESFCDQPEVSSEDFCSHFNLAELSQLGSVLTGAGGVALLAFVAWAGGAARRDHRKLLGLFRLSLVLVALGLVGLLLIQSANLVVVLYLLEVVFIERFHPFILAGIGLSGLVATLAVGAGVLQVFQPVKVTELAVAVTPEDQPGLWELAREVARVVGTEPPRTILLGAEPNCYVTEVPVSYPGGQSHGRLLYLSLPLLAVLERDELRAVLAHEFAHFHGEDTAFSRRFYPLYRGALQALGNAVGSLEENPRSIAVLPAIPVLGYAVAAFEVAAAERSRQRELVADRTAARVASSLAIATALIKVHLAGYVWPAYLHRLRQWNTQYLAARRRWEVATESGEDFSELAEIAETMNEPVPRMSAITTSEAADLARSQSAPSWLAAQTQPHPVDSHPPLAARLEALGVPFDEGWARVRASLRPVRRGTLTLGGRPVIAETRDIPGPLEPASRLLRDADRLEGAITALTAFVLFDLPAVLQAAQAERSAGHPGPGQAA